MGISSIEPILQDHFVVVQDFYFYSHEEMSVALFFFSFFFFCYFVLFYFRLYLISALELLFRRQSHARGIRRQIRRYSTFMPFLKEVLLELA